MSTTNTTTGSNQSTLQFNPLAQGVYNNMISGGGSVLGGYINNPFSNAMYQMGASQSAKGAQQAGQTNMQALLQNQKALGLGGKAGQGWLGAQQAQTGRANQAMSSQANVSNVLAALQRQMAATGMGMSFSPQLTGQSGTFNQQQTTSGLGTWLPQLMGAGLSAGLGAMTGGASSVLGGAMKMPSYMNGGPAMSSAFPGFGASGMQGTIPGIMNGSSPFSGMPMMPSFGGGN